MSRSTPPPQRLSEVPLWIETHGSDPAALAVLAWHPNRRFAVHDACIRALWKLGGAAALDALATYRNRDAGNQGELGDAWSRFDRREFARRVLSSPVTLSAKGGLGSIDGIEFVKGLTSLTIALADGCSIQPLGLCPGLISLDIRAAGDLDLTPITTLRELDTLVLRLRGSGVRTLDGLRGAMARKVELTLPAGVNLSFLEGLPRLCRVRMATDRPALGPADVAVLARLVARDVVLCGYVHEPWTEALRHLGARHQDVQGFRTVGNGELPDHLHFLSG